MADAAGMVLRLFVVLAWVVVIVGGVIAGTGFWLCATAGVGWLQWVVAAAWLGFSIFWIALLWGFIVLCGVIAEYIGHRTRDMNERAIR